VLALVQHFDGVSFIEAARMLGSDDVRPAATPAPRPRPAAPVSNCGDSKRTQLALDLFSEGRDPQGTIIESYFKRRGLALPENATESIRFHPNCQFAGQRLPCMIALVRDVMSNIPKAIHRAAIGPNGEKVSRLSLGPVGGGAVKLTPDEHVTTCLGIGEGIESVLSMRLASEFGESPVWALLSAGQVKEFPILPGIETLWIAVDHDTAGVMATNTVAHRWWAANREVLKVTPKIERFDLNDLARPA
jgi:hypothetical protein